MTIPVPGNVPQFQVTGIMPGQYQTDAAGNTSEGHEVFYSLSDGTSGKIFVPNAQWNVDHVQEMIHEAVQTTYAIRNLGNMAG